jgi:AcrR family transcriptional regulator
MPKVKEDYFERKKEAIIEAAIAVCNRKPIYLVTMKDIITEAGLSKGGIYLYFADIDELLVEVINRCNPEADYRDKIDAVIEESSNYGEALRGLFAFIGKYMQQASPLVGKTLFELTIMLTNYPERAEKIFSKISEQQSGQYFNAQVYSVISKGITAGYFKAALPLKDIITYLSVSMDGIVLNQVLGNCYNSPFSGNGNFDTVSMTSMLAEALLGLLGINSSKKGV